MEETMTNGSDGNPSKKLSVQSKPDAKGLAAHTDNLIQDYKRNYYVWGSVKDSMGKPAPNIAVLIDCKILPVPNLRNIPDGGKGPLLLGDDRKELIDDLQGILIKLGSLASTKNAKNGTYDNSTESAVKNFQRKNKDRQGKQLEVDGKVGPDTSGALNTAIGGFKVITDSTGTYVTVVPLKGRYEVSIKHEFFEVPTKDVEVKEGGP
jgi:Putative peptidoglycan binding domain